MIVLGFDTATSATAVALMLDDGSAIEARDDPPAGARPGHSTQLLPLAHELLAQAQIGWRDVERIGVGVGPGTFTGLRIGVASARAFAQSLDVGLVGVSSAQALARAAGERVLAVIDARRGEVFAGAYDSGEELVPPRAVPPQRLGEVLQPVSDGEPPTRWTAVGDGALRFGEALRALGVSLPAEGSPLHRIRGRAICELAACAPAGAREAIVPAYGRAPDAKPAAGAVAR